ncbi:hypothetical protein PFISCL1PPCAC_20821, partial [Pristionchus fissidentatus]
FSAQSSHGEEKPVLVFGTSNGNFLQVVEAELQQRTILVASKVANVRMAESIVGIKENRETGWCMILGREGTLTQISPQHFVPNADYASKAINTLSVDYEGSFIGFLTVQAKQSCDRMDLIVSTCKGTLFLHELSRLEIVCSVTDGTFSNDPISAHFVGDSSDRRIRLITTLTALKAGATPRLVCVEGTLKCLPKEFNPSSTMCTAHMVCHHTQH